MESKNSIRPARLFYGYIVILASFILMVVSHGTFFSYGIFFKPLQETFGWSSALIAGAYSLASVVSGLLGIAAGRWGDRAGPRQVCFISGAFMGAGYLLMSVVSQPWQLYLFYGVIVGTGMSGWWPVLLSLVPRWFVRRRGFMAGVVASGIGLGTMLASPLFSRLILGYGWGFAYQVMGAATLLLTLAATGFLRSSAREMGLTPYGEVPDLKENPTPHGLPFREVVRLRQFYLLAAFSFCFGYVVFTIMVHIVPHARELGLSPTQAADILAVVGWVSFLGRIAAGLLTDRIGNKRGLVLGFTLMFFSFLWLLFSREAWMLYLFAAVFGLAYASLSLLQTLMAAELFGLRALGIIVGGIGVGFALGQSVGPVVAGAIFDQTRGYQLAFAISLGLSILGLALTLLLRPVRNYNKR